MKKPHELSRTQIEALEALRWSHRQPTLHYNTWRSLRNFGLVRFAMVAEENRLVLTPNGKLLAEHIGDTIEGTAPLGLDADGNQIRQVTLGDYTFTWGY